MKRQASVARSGVRSGAPALTLDRRYFAVVGGILVLLLAALVALSALRLRTRTPAPYEGTRLDAPAPDFALTDHAGRTLSLAELRGKAVVLTFMDAKCRDTCPITSLYLRQAYEKLGGDASSTAFVGVNVNPAAPHPADVAEATRKFGLSSLPSWRYVTGTEPQLRPVWEGYKVVALGPSEHPARPGHAHPPELQGKPHAHAAPPGWGIDEVSHSSGVFIIDPAGRQRWYVLPPREPGYAGAPMDELIVRRVREVLAEAGS